MGWSTPRDCCILHFTQLRAVCRSPYIRKDSHAVDRLTRQYYLLWQSGLVPSTVDITENSAAIGANTETASHDIHSNPRVTRCSQPMDIQRRNANRKIKTRSTTSNMRSNTAAARSGEQRPKSPPHSQNKTLQHSSPLAGKFRPSLGAPQSWTGKHSEIEIVKFPQRSGKKERNLELEISGRLCCRSLNGMYPDDPRSMPAALMENLRNFKNIEAF